MKQTFKLLSLFVLATLIFYSHTKAQTLKHSYTFEEGTYDIAGKVIYDQAGTANGTITGDGLSFKNGSVMHTCYQKEYNSHISFDGTALALNTYSAVTMEYYITSSSYATNYWTMFAYFGGDGGATSFYSTIMGSSGQSRASLNNTYYATGTKAAARTNHHYVAVLKPTIATPTDTTLGSLAWYIDGVLIQSTALSKADTSAVKNISTKNSWIFKGPWSDNKWLGTLHEFNIYDGAMDAATVAVQNEKFNSQLATLTTTAGVLKPVFASGIYDYALHLTSATTTLDIAATASLAAATIKGTGTYDVSGNEGVIKVYVDTARTVPYFIHWDKPITAELKHSYTFENNTSNDIVSGANGTLIGTNCKVANGAFVATAGGNLTTAGASNHITLPVNKIALNKYPSFTMEAYIMGTTTGNPNTYISYFGGQAYWGVNHFYMNATGSTMSGNILYNPWGGSSAAGFGSTLNGAGHHIVTVVASDTMYSYTDGVLSNKTLLGGENQIFNIANDTAYVGRSGYKGDKNFIGTISEYNIYKGALDTAVIRTRSAAFHNSDALLKSMTISTGTLSPAFNTVDTSFTAILPVGTASVLLSAIPSNALAAIADTGTVNVSSGSAIRKVVVTAPDGTTKTTRTINLRYISNDSILSDLTVGGTTVTGFAPNVYTYEVALPGGTATVPTVAGTVNFAGAKAVVTPATALPGSTTVVVTAENGTSKTTYTVNFTFIDPTIVVDRSILLMDDLNAKDSLIVSGANLTADITITAPAGITVSPVTIPSASASNIKVYVIYDSITVVNDTIRFTSGTLVQKVAVKAGSNASCYTPLYATGNLIADPGFNSATLADGGFGGWGPTVLSKNYLYCGRGSAYIRGSCWPDGGSIDRSLSTANGNALKPLTKYRLRAMVKSQASAATSFQFQIEGVNGTTSQFFNIPNTNGWKQIDTTFITGATVTEKGIYFNSCGSASPALTDTCFIDNYELYMVPATDATLSDLKVDGTTVTGFDAGTITYSVILPFGTTVVPVVSATVSEPNATTVITQAVTVNGSATVEVTAQDGTTKITYTINFSVNSVNVPTIASNSLATVKPTISSTGFHVEFTGKLGKISVMDTKGNLISSKVALKSSEFITVPSSGVFIIQINVDGVILNTKVVKTN